MIDVNSPFFLFLLIFIPLFGAVLWMFYIWYYRGVLVNKKFHKATAFWERYGNLEESILNKCGNFSIAKSSLDVSAAIYNQYSPNGTRHIWYLAIKLRNEITNDIPDGIYGKGHAIDFCSESSKLDKRFERSEFTSANILPEGWSFIEVVEGSWLVFYRLPDLWGYGVLASVVSYFSRLKNSR
jgi:hypothetical protein